MKSDVKNDVKYHVKNDVGLRDIIRDVRGYWTTWLHAVSRVLHDFFTSSLHVFALLLSPSQTAQRDPDG